MEKDRLVFYYYFFHFPCLIFLCTKHILQFTFFHSNSLQPAFDFTIIHIEKFHYKLQTTFQNKKEMRRIVIF